MSATEKLSGCRVRVSGRVQGVWFRDSTRKEAMRLGVSGWVRNLPDGAVEAEFYGSVAAVEQVVAWCRKGPPLAHVERVEVQSLPVEEGETPPGFVVRY